MSFSASASRIAILCLSGGLVACSLSDTNPLVTSDLLSAEQIQAISQNITEQHPDANAELQHHILDVAVKTLENMIFVEGGSFMMGDFLMPCEFDNLHLVEWTPDATCASTYSSQRSGSLNLHKVTLSNYSLAKYETTYYEMNAYQLAHQLPLINIKYNHKALKEPTPTKTWQEAKNYCTWVGKITGYPVDLPTEAQWEYAARNRGKYIYFATNDGKIRQERGGRYLRNANDQLQWEDWLPEEWNYADDPFYDVGTWPANPLGIYDLSSNATEWVNDWYSSDYYANSPEQDPQGPTTGTHKVQRGWHDDRPIVTSRSKGKIEEKKYYPMFGFRCALQQPHIL